MHRSFIPRLINDPFSDPGLYIPFRFEKRALLFDLGELTGLSPRDLLKITHVFVTHTHMDHFIGFDTLLRIFLGRDKVLHLFGPPGFLQQVEAKLAGYTWNLVHEYETDLLLRVSDVGEKDIMTRQFICRRAFQAEEQAFQESFQGILLGEGSFRVNATLLDHQIPCLGLSLEENFHINIIKENLREMGLPVGSWLNRFKKCLYEKRDTGELFRILPAEAKGLVDEKVFFLGELAKRIARISPGQKITYVTDAGFTRANEEKIIALAKDADHFFVEAAFLEKDKTIARKKYHLTARQAGLLARRAGVKQLHPFHFSPRYEGRGEELEREAMETFLQGADEA
ncbi:MAG: ribonuclease Z [Deltaproteobacteria bacterium]|nr:ribonuclease Z [Deltaproteobacteria bacterium]